LPRVHGVEKISMEGAPFGGFNEFLFASFQKLPVRVFPLPFFQCASMLRTIIFIGHYCDIILFNALAKIIKLYF
jgi:hypothetical protein